MIIDSPIISGSTSATGSLNQVGNVTITGSLTVTGAIIGAVTGSVNSASFSQTAISSSYAASATSSSFATTAISSSYPLAVSGSVIYTTTGTPYLSKDYTAPTIAIGKNIGSGSLLLVSNPGYNVYIGHEVALASTESSDTVAIGTQAGYQLQNIPTSTVMIGSYAGFRGNNLYWSTLLGYEVARNTSDSEESTIIGYAAAGYANKLNKSVLLGTGVASSMDTGSLTTAIGYYSLGYSAKSIGSVFLGAWAGSSLTSGSNNIVIGPYSARNVTLKRNNIIIGTNISLPANAQDSINIGGLIFGTGSAWVGVNSTYDNYTANPFSGSAMGKIGINQPTPQYSFDVSGSGNFTNGLIVTGSLIATSFTGSLQGTATNATLLNNSGSGEFVPTGSFNTFSSSILTYTGSNNTNISNIHSTTASLNTFTGSATSRLNSIESTTGSLNTASGSAITRLNALEVTSGSNISRLSSLESKTGSYATTGSNTFVSTQYISASNNPTGFTTTASLYTDGGLRVTKDAYISGTLYLNNVTVYGTQSIAYISSSQLNIASNLITVNTATPSVQFGGLAVYDSGSSGLTGSILWDSTNNRWIYSNPSGSTYDGGMLISGPRNSSGLGNEVGTTACALMMGQGGDHITSSAITHYSTATCFYGTSYISGSGAACFGSQVCSPTFDSNCARLIGKVSASPYANSSWLQAPTSSGMFIVNNGITNWIGVKADGTIDSSGTFTHGGVFCASNTVCAPTIISSGTICATGNTCFGGMSIHATCVGIGTATPDIFSRGDGFDVGISSAGVSSTQNMSLQLNAGATAGRGAQIYMGQGGTRHFTISSNTTESSIGTTSNTPLRFVTCDSLERLRISNTGIACFACQVCAPTLIGAVGCFTTVCGGGGYFTGFGINSTPSSQGTSANFIRFDNSGNSLYLGQESCTSGNFFPGSVAYDNVAYMSCPFNFIINGISRLYITANGYVGIGYRSPVAKLHVASCMCNVATSTIPSAGNGTCSTVTVFTNGDPSYGTLFGTLNTGVGWIQQQRTDGTASVYNLLLQPNGGCIGIGTNSPQRILHLKTGVAGVSQILMENSTKCYATGLAGGDGDAWNVYDLTSSSTRMSIRGTGEVVFACQVCAPAFYSSTSSSTLNGLLVTCTISSRCFTGITVENFAGAGSECARAGIVFKGYDWVQGGIWHGRNGGAFDGALVFGTNPDTTNLTAGGLCTRLVFNNAGIACFACQVCAPTLVSNGVINWNGTVGALSYGGGIVTMETNSLTCIQLKTNGTAAVTISTGQNVGISTTPAYKLHVYGTDSAFDTASSMRLYLNRAGVNVGSIIFTTGGPGTSNGWAEIGQTAADGDLYFKANPSAGAFTTRLVIKGDTGSLLPGANGTQDLGSSTCRWCTVYTSDLSLNNGIGNYTIVEGENDLFLYNNNSCKVFKFLLQEVCPEIAPAKRSI